MTDTISTHKTVETLQPEPVQLRDLTDWAEALTHGLNTTIDEDTLSPAARLLLDAAARVYDRYAILDDPANAPGRRLAYVLMLDAFISAPEAVQQALQGLRDDLVASDPTLALVGSVEGRPTPPA